MTQIYYDPTGGFLYGIDSNGNPELIKTDACVMMPENVFVDSLGQIHVKNLQGSDTIIMDESGNPATLRGPEGQPGIQGEQGRPSIFRGTISTPSDMDIKIYKGAQIGDSYIIAGVDDNLDLPIEEQNGSIFTVIDDKNETWVYSGNIRGPKGVNGITPQLKIEDGYWYISYDNGATWTQLGKATGEDGKDGKDGANGADGRDGQNGADGKDGQDGADGYNPFTEEEVAQLKTLPETITNLQSRITALEQALQQIDLSGLSIAYPILAE